MAPPHSYIDASDFPSARALAEHLLFLHENPEEYLSYFWWTDKFRAVDAEAKAVKKKSQKYILKSFLQSVQSDRLHGAQAMCELCRKLNSPEEPPKVYGDIVT